MQTALLVIDIQNDYFPGGKYPLVKPLEAAKKAYELLQCFRELGGRHVHIQHISTEPDADFFIKGDSGSDIHDSVAHFEGEPIVYKHFPNSFLETNLLEMLREWDVERVVVTGMMTHMCVDATARAAVDFGFEVIVAEDACASRDLEYGGTTILADLVHKSFLAALTWYGKVMKTDEVLAMLANETIRA
ncbi:MAG: Peroxyureidoacrylate/ureidoacrylate amidohydrolase RutB [Anaerolineales bacterium]|nr:Peroxyureidoacrylate/ureidoacrylate amidohydrolase RutB [Anaerolineales bacterium]